MGVPGLVVPVDGDFMLEVTNIEALSQQFNLVETIARVNSDAEQAIKDEGGVELLVVNDGDLAAYAARDYLSRIGHYEYDNVADVIIGTGVGAAGVVRDERFKGVYNSYSGGWELGHTPDELIGDYTVTAESLYAGPALNKAYDSPDTWNDEVYGVIAAGASGLAIQAALLGGAEAVVYSGGVAIKSQARIADEVAAQIGEFKKSNNRMARLAPDVYFVPRNMEDKYELYGAAGVVDHHRKEQRITEGLLVLQRGKI